MTVRATMQAAISCEDLAGIQPSTPAPHLNLNPKIMTTLIIGISGVSSSGKTTLSRLLRDIWTNVNTFVIHEDDFYWPDEQIPIHDGVQDWDCLESLDLEKLKTTLEYIKKHGKSPSDLQSKEDQNSVGESGVDPEAIKYWNDIASTSVRKDEVQIVVIDGFLLYAKQMKEIWNLLDVRLFLRAG